MMETWTQEDMRTYAKGGHVPRKAAVATNTVAAGELTHAKARATKYGPRHVIGQMNKLESRYSEELKAMELAKLIKWWAFEPCKLRLADKTFYTPDFCVIHVDGTVEFVETKGFWRDDARVKIKVAARMFPAFSFVALTPVKGGGWKREVF